MKAFSYATLICLVLLTTDCSSRQIEQSCEGLLSDIPPKARNSDLKITVPKYLNTFKGGQDIKVVVDNYSQTEMQAAPDEDLKVFWWAENSWLPLRSEENYLSRTDLLGPKTKDHPGESVYVVSIGFFRPHQYRSNLCITLTGVENPNGNPTRVGASRSFVFYPYP